MLFNTPTSLPEWQLKLIAKETSPKTKSYKDYILQAINNGQREYKQYLPFLGKDKLTVFDDGLGVYYKSEKFREI